MAIATLTSKGQITIPRSVRDSLQLHTGDRVEFVVCDSREARIRPITRSVDEVFGKLHDPSRRPLTVAEMDAAVARRLRRGLR